jgi:hypothetical protein
MPGKPEKRNDWEDQGACGRITLRRILEIRFGGVVWIGLAHNRDKWRALLNAVMNFVSHRMLGNYPIATQLMASRVVLSSVELVSQFMRGEMSVREAKLETTDYFVLHVYEMA